MYKTICNTGKDRLEYGARISKEPVFPMVRFVAAWTNLNGVYLALILSVLLI